MKRLGLLIAVLALGASSAWGFGGHRDGMQGGHGYALNLNFASNMNLTEDQQAQLDAKREAFMAETDPLRDELFSKRMELRELWTKANPSQDEISAKQQEIREIQTQMQEKATEYQLELRQLLTPEQREQLAAAKASFGGKGGGFSCRMGRW
jgi:Spy/CpxP family protein refolding chaperone